MVLADQPIRTAEFVAVDTETNGLGGDGCEITEVGAVLVGGGELHDRWSSLVRVNLPLRRGIQRFTGITQAMVDSAPEPDEVLPELLSLLDGKVMVAHNAAFDRRVLRQAAVRIGLEWPDPPVLCTAALARTLLPLQRERRLGTLAEALGIEVDVAHRALADAETCGRVLCALFPRLCANAGTIAEALALLAPRRRRRAGGGNARGRMRTAGGRRASAHGSEPPAGRSLEPPPGGALEPPPARRQELPATRMGESPFTSALERTFAELPRDPGVYLFRDDAGRTVYVGKSVSIRSRARAHFSPSTPPARWTAHAVIVDYRATGSELGALVLENRLIKELRPPGNTRLTRTDDRLVYIQCRLDIPFPILEVARAPAAGHAVTIGPLRERRLALELVEQLESLFGLRHCGRKLPRREHPSAYGQMGRCLSPCLGDLDPNLYRRRLDAALAAFVDPAGASAAQLLAHVRRQMQQAASARRYERAAGLRRRVGRLGHILERLGGVLQATHVAPRLIVAPHPGGQGGDVFWVIGGRIRDWGPVPTSSEELYARTLTALRHASRPGEVGAHVPPGEIDEMRILGTYLLSHPEVKELALQPAPDPEKLRARVQQALCVQPNGSSTTSADTDVAPTETLVPGGASRRTSARATAPNLGDTAALETVPTSRSAAMI